MNGKNGNTTANNIPVIAKCFAFSSVTDANFEENLEKKVLKFNYIFTNFKLYKAPLTETEDNFIRENQSSVFFLNQKNWI